MKTGWEAIVVGNQCIQGVSIFPFLCWFCNSLTVFFKTEPSSFLLILYFKTSGFLQSMIEPQTRKKQTLQKMNCSRQYDVTFFHYIGIDHVSWFPIQSFCYVSMVKPAKERVPNWFFGIRDSSYLTPGIRKRGKRDKGLGKFCFKGSKCDLYFWN